jgi:hypothetical protein
MRACRHTLPLREFAGERWILEPDARSAIVRVHTAFVATAALVGSTVRVDGCEYRCVAVEHSPGEAAQATGARLRLFVESL